MNGWLKFAISGSTYARALQNAGQRAGRNMDALKPGLDAIAAQPQARLKPGLSSMVRERGALTPTPQQAGMQKMLAKTPWAGTEHGGNEHAVGQFNALLKRRGLEQNTPAGQPTTQDLIHKSFGPPQVAYSDPVTRNVPYLGKGPSPFSLMDKPFVPGKTEMPAQNTRVGVPMPSAASAQTDRLPPAARPLPRNEQTVVSHGEWMPEHVRMLPPHVRDLVMSSMRPNRPSPVTPASESSIGQGRAATPEAGTAVLPRKHAFALPAAAGAAIPLAIGGGMLLNKPGIKANVNNLLGHDVV